MEPFEGLLGNNCELKLIEYLLPLEGLEFNITELAEEANISRATVTKVVQKFVEWNLLTFDKSGNVKNYSINTKSPIIASIQHFNNTLIEAMLGDDALYEIHDYLEEKGFSGMTHHSQKENEIRKIEVQSTTSEKDIPNIPCLWNEHPSSWGGIRSPNSIFGGM